MKFIDPKDTVLDLERRLHNPGPQRSFLAALMQRPDFMVTAAGSVPPEWLPWKNFQTIYRLMLRLDYAARQNGWTPKFDAETLFAFAKHEGTSDAIGKATDDWKDVVSLGHLAVSPIFNAAESAAQIFQMLQEGAARLELFQAAVRLQRGLEDRDPGQLLAEMQNDLCKIQTGTKRDQGITSVGDGSLLSTRARGIRPSHLPRLCDLTNGFAPGTLSILCARTNVGKSLFMGNIAFDVAVKQRIPVLYLDSEMTRDAMLRRAVSWHTGIDENVLVADYELQPDIRKQADDAHAIIRSSPLMIAPVGLLTHEQMAALMRQFKRQFVQDGPGLIVFDYLKAAGGKIPEYQVLGDLAQGLRSLAAEIELPILAGMQASRAALALDHNGYGQMGVATAAGSDRPAHHADLFMTLRNVTEPEADRIRTTFGAVDAINPRNRLRFNQVLYINKQRSGPTEEKGIPLYHSFGQHRYTERGYATSPAGELIIEDGRKVLSDETTLLHSSEFAKKAQRTKAAMFPTAPALAKV